MSQNKVNKYNVVIQLTSDDEIIIRSLLNQLNNLLISLPEINIEVVVHSKGVKMLLKDSSFKNNLEKANKSGVKFLACNNTLVSQKINSGDLIAFCTVIPSAVAHLVVRQHEGWAYLKAG